jgi:Zn-dependent protease
MMTQESTTILGAPLPLSTAAPSNEAVWVELERLEARKGSWVGGLILMGVTLAAALGIGSHQWTFEKAALIMGIIFIHELGHYVAMRWFGYREVRMFFIPLVGAAVTGRNHNVPGWKKAIVALMGPVPGIFLGTFLGVFAAVVGNHWLAELSILAVIINALNLFPFVPLDGGWFWNAVVFSRHYRLEMVFKIIAALGGIAATIAGLGIIWMFFGVVTLVGVPFVSMQGRIVQALRLKGVTGTSDDGDTLSRDLGNRIFDEINASTKGLTPQVVASLGLRVFERLNARPPSVLESIGLSALYFIAIGAAIVGFAFAGYALFGDGLAGTPGME